MIGEGTRFERYDYDLLGRVLAEKRRRADEDRRGGEFHVVRRPDNSAAGRLLNGVQHDGMPS